MTTNNGPQRPNAASTTGPGGFVETFEDAPLIMTYGPSGAGKCLSESCEVLLATGEVRTVKDLVTAGLPVNIVALGPDYRVRSALVSNFYDNGRKIVWRVETASGRVIEVTDNHPLYGKDGWMEVKSFAPGDFIAVPRVLNYFGTEEMSEARVKLLAYHLADGVMDNGAISVTESNPEKVDDWISAVESFGGVEANRAVIRNVPTGSYRVRNAGGGHRGVENSVGAWLRSLGLDGKRAASKFVPDFVFRLRRPLVALFLNRYLGCDGCVEQRRGQVSFSSASERMLRQISHLLLRFGVVGRIRTKVVKGTTYWEWITNGAESVIALKREIGLFTKVIPDPPLLRPSHNDVLPLTNEEATPANRWRSAPTAQITRAAAQLLCDVADEVHKLAHSDIYWDTVKSITRVGIRQTYDLTVPVLHNFVANDIFAHNTTDLLFAFPNAFWVCAPGALDPAINVVGYLPPNRVKSDEITMDQITDSLQTLKSRGHNEIVIDDFSLVAKTTLDKKEAALKGQKTWNFWTEVSNIFLRFRQAARSSGMIVACNAHEKGPEEKDGMLIRGGPKLPVKQLTEELPVLFDCVFRCAVDSTQIVAGPSTGKWPGAYMCDRSQSRWLTKDRLGVAPPVGPQNIGMILRTAGFKISRPPGLEWMDEFVPVAVNAIVSGTYTPQQVFQEVVNGAKAKLASIQPHRQVIYLRAILRDIEDGVTLKKYQMGAIERQYGVKF